VSPKIPSTVDAAALCKMADRGQITGGLLDGPLAFDNAISLEAARTKKIESRVAGRADILVVPDLESGNMLAKQLQYLAGADSAGIVLGTRVPNRADQPLGQRAHATGVDRDPRACRERAPQQDRRERAAGGLTTVRRPWSAR